MCRELRKKDILSEVLRLSHDRSLNKYADVDDEDDFQVLTIIFIIADFVIVLPSGSCGTSSNHASNNLPAHTCLS